MKLKLRKLYTYIGGGWGIFLVLYLTCCLTVSSVNFAVAYPMYLAVALLTSACISVAVCPALLKFLSRLQLKQRDHAPKRKIVLRLFFFLLPLLVFLLYFLAYCPGGFSNDSINQLIQAQTNQYNDWHPVIHTLLVFKLPMMLTGGKFWSIVLFQIIALSAVLGYTFYFIYTHSNRKFTVLSILFILLNPSICNYAMFPWKDVTFGMGALLLTVYALQVLFSKGEWMKRPVHMIAFILTAVLTTLFRHNAVLFTVPLVLAVLLYISKKRALVLIMSGLTLFFCIKYPLYYLLEVESPDQRQVETLGMPVTIIGAVAAQNPDALDEETRTFIYKVAPKQVWEEEYRCGSFNSVKWNPLTNKDVIEEYGTAKVLSMTVKCFINAPVEATSGLVCLWRNLFFFTENCDCGGVYVADNSQELIYAGVGPLNSLCFTYKQYITIMFGWLFFCLGLMHLVLIASVLAKCKRKKWKKMLFVLPVFTYNIGTAFFMSCFRDTPRFFSYTFFLMPVLLLLIYHKDQGRNVAE